MILDLGSFIRVSSEDQVRGDSPQTHLDRAYDWASENNGRLVEIYQLDGVSGETTINLPEMRKLLFDAKTGRIQAVLVTRVDRLGRDAFELMAIERELRQYGVRIISIFEDIDTSTVEGMNRFIDICRAAQYERGRLSERVRAGMRQRMKRGHIVSGSVPYGYKKAGKSLEIDPVEGPIRREMYRLFLEHGKLMPVARELEKRGYKSREGNAFHITCIRVILADSSAMGMHYVGRTSASGKTKTKLPKDQWIEHPCEPLISVEDWEAAQRLLANSRKQTRSTVHIYSGLLKCGCGGPMYVRHSIRNKRGDVTMVYFCRACRNKIDAQLLDATIGGLITGFCLKHLPPETEIAAEDAGRSLEEQLQAVDALRAKLLKKQANLIDLAQDGLIDKAQFKERNEKLQPQLDALNAEKQRLEFERAEASKVVETAQSVQASGLGDLITWDMLSPSHKALLLRDFVRRLRLTPSKLELTPFFLPQGLELNTACNGSGRPNLR